MCSTAAIWFWFFILGNFFIQHCLNCISFGWLFYFWLDERWKRHNQTLFENDDDDHHVIRLCVFIYFFFKQRNCYWLSFIVLHWSSQQSSSCSRLLSNPIQTQNRRHDAARKTIQTWCNNDHQLQSLRQKKKVKNKNEFKHLSTTTIIIIIIFIVHHSFMHLIRRHRLKLIRFGSKSTKNKKKICIKKPNDNGGEREWK